MKVEIKKIVCQRCGHQWTPRTEEVIKCPKCSSPYFNRERKEKIHGNKQKT